MRGFSGTRETVTVRPATAILGPFELYNNASGQYHCAPGTSAGGSATGFAAVYWSAAPSTG